MHAFFALLAPFAGNPLVASQLQVSFEKEVGVRVNFGILVEIVIKFWKFVKNI